MLAKSYSLIVLFSLAAQVNVCAQIPFRTNSGWKFVNEANPSQKLYNGEFEEIQPLTDELFVFTRKGESAYKSLVTKDGKSITQSKYAAFQKLTDELIAFTETGKYNSIQGDIVGGKWGIMDKTGAQVLPAAYHQIHGQNSRFFIVQMDENWGNWGVIDHKGNWVEKPIYPTKSFDMRPHSSIYFLDEQHIMIDAGENVWKIKNLYTKKTTTLKSEDPWGPWFNEGIGVVFLNENDSYVISAQGKTLIPKGIATFSAPQYGLIVGENKAKRKIYLYSKAGQKINEMTGEIVSDFAAGFGVYKNDDTWYVFNENGKVVLSDSKEIKLVSVYGFATIKSDEKTYVLVDLNTGKKHSLPEGYSVESAFSKEGLAVVKNEKYEGIYNFTTGKFTVPCMYWDITHWKNELFKVRFSYNQHAYIHGTTGLKFFDLKKSYEIDRWQGKSELRDALTQELIFQEKFDNIEQVFGYDSLFIARIENNYFALNASSQKMSEAYNYIAFSKNHFLVAKAGKQGVLNLNMKEIVPVNYQKVEVYVSNSNAVNEHGKSNLFIVQNKKYGVIDESGKMILDTIYEQIPSNTSSYLLAKRRQYGNDQDCSLLDNSGKLVQEAEHALYTRLLDDTAWLEITKKDGNTLLFNCVTNQKLFIDKGIKIKRKVNGYFGENETYFFYESKGKFGIINDKNQIILVAKEYDYLSAGDWDLQFFRSKKGALVFFNTGNKLETRKVEGIEIIQDQGNSEWNQHIKSRYALKEKGNYYLVNNTLEKIDGTAYKQLIAGNTLILAQNLAGKYGAINQFGNQLVPFEYDNVEIVDVWSVDGLKKDGLIHLFDPKGEEILKSLKVKKIFYSEFSDETGIYLIETNEGKSLVDLATNEIILNNFIDVIFDESLFYYESEFSYYNLIIKTDKGHGVFSIRNKKFFIEPTFDKISVYFHYASESTLLLTEKDGKYSFFDPRQNVFITKNPITKFVNDYKKEEVIVCIVNDSLTFIAKTFDIQNFVVISTNLKPSKYKVHLNYDLVWNDNQNPVIQVKENKKIGLLRMDGVWIHDVSLDDFDYTIYDEKYMIVRKENLQYLIRLNGTYITTQGFDSIDFMSDDKQIAVGMKGNTYFQIQENGTVIELKEN